MDTKHFTAAEDDAIIAGLRLLQCSLEKQPGHHPVEPNDGDVGDILTNSGEHAGLTVGGSTIGRPLDRGRTVSAPR